MTTFAAASSVILFIISIITFVSSLISKAQNDGKILANIDIMQKDITEIKNTLKERAEDLLELKTRTENQEVRIKALEEKAGKFEERIHTIELKG